MDQPIDHSCGYDDVAAKDLTPAAKGTVGGQDHAASLVTAIYHLEEEIGRRSAKRDVPHFVHDQQIGLEQLAKHPSQRSLFLSCQQLGDHLDGGEEEHCVACLAGLESQGDYLRGQWREVLGVDIPWEGLEFAAFLEGLRGRRPDIWIIGWWAKYPDPDHFLRAAPDPKRTGWRHQVFDRLVEEARTIADQAERLKLYAEAERILVEEAAIVPLIHWRWHRLVKAWVKRFPSSGIYLPAWKQVIIEPH